MPKMPIVSAVITPERDTQLRALRKRDNISMSQLINELIDMALDKREAWTPPQVELPKPPKL